MSEQETAVPVAATVAPVATPAPAPAAPKSAIELIEAQIVAFFQQKERAVANLHAIDGAIQGAQHLAQLLKQEALRAEQEALKLLNSAKTGLTEVVDAVEAEAKKI